MARVRFYNGAETSDALGFGEFTAERLTSATSTRVVLTGADGQRFIATGRNISFDVVTGEATGVVTRVEWRSPDNVLLGIVDQVSVSVAKMVDYLFIPPDSINDPHGPEDLFVDVMKGDDLFVGPGVRAGDQVYTRYLVGGGDDTVRGGAANETVEVTKSGGVIHFDGGAGRDVVFYLYGGFDEPLGVNANLVTGRIANPFGGTDTVRNVEMVVGTLRDDTMLGGRGDETLDGGFGGRERLNGGAGDDSIVAADDRVSGRDDTLYGGAGDDTIAPGTGRDFIDGGAGRDLLRLTPENFAQAFDVVVDLVRPGANRGEHVDDTIRGIEDYAYAMGLNADSTVRFVGNGAGNAFSFTGFAAGTLAGGAGDDDLRAGLADDRLDGGAGNDTLLGGYGADTLTGGAGLDVVTFIDANALVDLATPSRSTDEAEGDLYRGVEEFRGMAIFRGGKGDDVARDGHDMDGRGGDDLLDGGTGADRLRGNVGDDTLYGGERGLFSVSLVDTLEGGAGQDLLISGETIDQMRGGDGSDVYAFRTYADLGVLSSTLEIGRDRVLGFESGEDTLRFTAAGFEGMTETVRLVQNADPRATAAAPTFLFETDSGRLSFDADGRGGEDALFLLTIVDVSRLRAGDFDIL
jgi:Ca2+-binding RTX toxin-like protein